jgi:hypothetical protein
MEGRQHIDSGVAITAESEWLSFGHAFTSSLSSPSEIEMVHAASISKWVKLRRRGQSRLVGRIHRERCCTIVRRV